MYLNRSTKEWLHQLVIQTYILKTDQLFYFYKQTCQIFASCSSQYESFLLFVNYDFR